MEKLYSTGRKKRVFLNVALIEMTFYISIHITH